MRLARAALRTVAVLLIAVVGAGAIVAAVLTLRGLPQTAGAVRIPALHAPVTVARDRYGIVQIAADDSHDLFVAQGYVHAQERMWQMELSRRIGAGRLAELFGESLLDTDRYIRTLGWRLAAERDLAALSPETVAMLEAYAEGINAWIDEHDGRLPAAFVIAGLLSGSGNLGGFELEPWTPLDSATWQKVQAWSLGGNVDAEIFRLLADAQLGDPALTDQLFPGYGDWAPVITPSGLAGSGGAGAAAGARGDVAAVPPIATAQADALTSLGRLGATVRGLAGFDGGGGLAGDHGVGSNNWVVSGAHTASGKPILANDPHLGFAMPSVWIMNGLHCRTVSLACSWDVTGVSFPGAPAVILGHNARIAWGATNVGPDTQDLFLETLDPSDPGRYVFRGESLPFDVRRETIRVAGGADVTLDVRSTIHGPILSDVDERLEDGPVLAVSWVSLKEPDRTLDAIVGINVALDFDEFRAAFQAFGQPSQNFVYADVDGHIGYVLPGLIPVRDGGNGERVRDGASGGEEWTGWVPRDALPWQLDPPSGRIVTANNAPVDLAYPYWIGPWSEFDPGYRAAQIEARLGDLFSAGVPLEPSVMRALQLDSQVLRADRVVPAILALAPEPGTDDGRAVLAAIENWDRTCDVGSQGCAAYMPLELLLQRAIFDDELGPLARDYVGVPPSWVKLVELLEHPGVEWWDDVATAEDETPLEIVTAALDRAGAGLRATLGEPAGWRWGRLHRVTFADSTLGGSGIGPLEWYFNAEPREVGGANGAILNTYYRLSRAYADPYDPTYLPVGLGDVFTVTNGPSYRLVVDMADLDGASIVITTGQSGNPFDAHYGDLIDTWAGGGTLPLPFSAPAIEAATVSQLTLEP
ncbi:MAG TPA: penicillin acylase family protein [Candidatus Deferrimicrobiaceae bacterium]|nr:penicillin acylase family protein [Candidatus Deferrimicrobiaceae bacterium]